MKDKIIKNRQTKITICAYISIILLIISISLGIYKYNEEKNAINISATIISIENNNNKTTATVKYFVLNKKYEGQVNLNNSSNLAVNETTHIKVDMRNPNRQINNLLIYVSIALFILSLILAFISLPSFIKYIKNQKRIKLLRQKGIYLQATITGIYANNKGKTHKRMYPHRLRCQYLNPQDNQEYIFDSEDTFLDLENIIKQNNVTNITVYLDKTNPTNYYVDLSSLQPKINIINPLEFMKNNSSDNKGN